MTTNCTVSGCSNTPLPTNSCWWENGFTIESYIHKMPYCEKHRKMVVNHYHHYHSNPAYGVDFRQMAEYKEYTEKVRKLVDEVVIPDLSNMVCDYI